MKIIEEVLSVNMYKKVRDEMEPYPTKYGGYVWLREPNEFYEDFIGLMPPKEKAVPKKINEKWFWIYGDNNQEQEG